MDKDAVKQLNQSLKKAKAGGFFVYYKDKDNLEDSEGHNLLISKKIAEAMKYFKDNKKTDSKIAKGTVQFSKKNNQYLFMADDAGGVARVKKGVLKLAGKGATGLKQVIFPSPDELASFQSEAPYTNDEDGTDTVESEDSTTDEDLSSLDDLFGGEDTAEAKAQVQALSTKLASLRTDTSVEARQQAKEALGTVLTGGLDGISEGMRAIVQAMQAQIPEPTPLTPGAPLPDVTRMASLAEKFNRLMRTMSSLEDLRSQSTIAKTAVDASNKAVLDHNAAIEDWKTRYESSSPPTPDLTEEGSRLDSEGRALDSSNQQNLEKYQTLHSRIMAEMASFDMMKAALEALAKSST